MKTFKDMVAVITGGASGIGKALGEILAHLGAKVVLSDLNQANLEKVIKGITSSGGSAWGEILNVTDYEAFKKHLEGVVLTHASWTISLTTLVLVLPPNSATWKFRTGER